MPRINVKLDDVQSGFELFPDTKIIVKIQDNSRLAKSQEGNPKIIWIGKVIEPDELVDKMYSWDTSLLPQALFKLKSQLEAMDMAWDEDGFELEDCFDMEVGIVNKVKVYNDEDRNNVKSFFNAGQGIPDSGADPI